MAQTEAIREYLYGAPNLNHLWARLLIEELWRQGVRSFFLGPGSRNTPLAVALAEHPGHPDSDARPEVTVHVDERGGAFAALGVGKASGMHPAAWITTSGTAVANGLPAAIEADASGVPLLLITADRPHELRETGANQTIRQPGLFASVTRWAFDFPVPTAEIDPAFVLTTVSHAVARAIGRSGPAGPVHLNMPFREPLAPVPDGAEPPRAILDRLPGRWFRPERVPYTRVSGRGRMLDGWSYPYEQIAEWLSGTARGLLIAGPVDSRSGMALRGLADRIGWPMLPDILSHARLGQEYANGCPYFDLALASRAFAEAHRPETVLHVGARSTSKRLQALVEATRPDSYVVAYDGPGRFDPGHRVTLRIEDGTAEMLQYLQEHTSPSPFDAWSQSWKAASDAVADVLDDVFSDDRLTEPRVARLITERILEGQPLFAAASMPIRDLNTFAVPDGKSVGVAANRGASGIDGTVATAVGFSGGSFYGPTVLLIGDLALLHDLNSLALLREGPPLVIVVVNNDGGGIFHFLPVAPGAEAGSLAGEFFEPFFGAPHGLSFEHAARMFGLEYARPETASQFVKAFDAALRLSEATDDLGNTIYRRGYSTLIEVRTDREENAALHREIEGRCAEAVEVALGL